MNLNRIVITTGLMLAVLASVAASVFVANKDSNTFAPAAVVVQDDTTSTASIVMKAPDKAKVGQLVVLDVSESTANNFKWELLHPSANFLVIDNGRRAVFSAETGGDYTFVVAAVKDNDVDVKIHTIKVTGGQPQPGDDIQAKISAWCDPVSYPQKRDDLLKLAQSFSSISSVITDQMSPDDIVQATKRSNRDALGDNLQNWVPFLEGLQTELKALAEAGKLPDTEAHRQMWRAIADGLNDYAASI